jgi:hypothetical protein
MQQPYCTKQVPAVCIRPSHLPPACKSPLLKHANKHDYKHMPLLLSNRAGQGQTVASHSLSTGPSTAAGVAPAPPTSATASPPTGAWAAQGTQRRCSRSTPQWPQPPPQAPSRSSCTTCHHQWHSSTRSSLVSRAVNVCYTCICCAVLCRLVTCLWTHMAFHLTTLHLMT